MSRSVAYLQYKLQNQQLTIMNFEFDDDFFDKPNENKMQGNMQDILDEVDNIDWDNFGDVNDNSHSLSKSNISEMFNTEKKSHKEESVSRDFEMSRDINEISMIYASKRNQSFRFQLSDYRSNPQPNDRYQKLQTLLSQAKQNNLNAFYKNLDSQNAYGQIEPKFDNYGEFKNFTKQLKYKKRQEENKVKVAPRDKSTYQEMEEFNPFESKNNDPFGSHGDGAQFKKKNVFDSVKPSQYADFDFFAPNNENQSQKSNSYQKKQDSAVPNNQMQYNFQSYNQNSNKSSSQSFYDMIPQHSVRNSQHNDSYNHKQHLNKDNFFQKNYEESQKSVPDSSGDKKFEKLLNNYKNIRQNFEGMLLELKNTNEGQEKIVEEIRKLKESKMENEEKKEEEKRMRRMEKQREKQKQNEQIREIREEVGKINSNSRDILYLKMNEKIEQLQQIVRMALKEVNEEKQQKLQPKVINYFCDRDKSNKKNQNQNRYDEESSEHQAADFSRQEFNEKYETHSQSPNQGQKIKFTRQIIHSKQKSYKASPKYSQHEEQSRQMISSFPQRKINDFCSPLDLCFDEPVQKNDEVLEQIKFEPSEFAQKYSPKTIQYKNRNLKNCLTQKSSLVFQSFEFHVSARFTVADDPIHPLAAVVRVGNKCSIDLMDVHTIVYGPQGPGLQTEPPKMFNEQVKSGGSFSFTVFINKECFEDNGFSLQISYKTEGINKKKVNLKVPLPLIQLIKPQFIYQQQFIENWMSFEEKKNELYIKPKLLNLSNLRGHEDIKLILPFIDLTEEDPNIISYGIMFTYPKSDNLFLIKLQCYINSKASLILRTDKNTDRKIKQQILDVLNFLLFDPSDTPDFKESKNQN